MSSSVKLARRRPRRRRSTSMSRRRLVGLCQSVAAAVAVATPGDAEMRTVGLAAPVAEHATERDIERNERIEKTD